MTIAQQLKITTFPFEIKDNQGRLIYSEESNGFWWKKEFDQNGNQIYYENSSGYWCKWEFDQDGNVIYTEDSDGYIRDNRPKSEPEPEPEPKQETLEEAARRYTESTPDNDAIRIFSFIEGAKWQAERMYRDMREAFIAGTQFEEDYDYNLYMEKWFEQFKKNGGDK
jgi:hypothetical protein